MYVFITLNPKLPEKKPMKFIEIKGYFHLKWAVINGRMHKTQKTQNTIHVQSMYLNPVYCD